MPANTYDYVKPFMFKNIYYKHITSLIFDSYAMISQEL